MAEDTIQIPIMVEAIPFETLELNGVEKALAKCQDAGYSALFAPQVADGRILAPQDSYIVQNGFTTQSIRVTGRTKRGKTVVVYGHVPNYFSAPANIKKARAEGLVNGAGRMPQKEFYHLLDLEDGSNVFVVDYNALRNAVSGIVQLNDAMKHPQTIPFLGGEDRAEKYLEKHGLVYGKNIGIWHSDDLGDVPQGRLLVLGDDYDDCGSGLYGFCNLDGNARFAGVLAAEPPIQVNAREAPRENGAAPDLENILGRLTHLLAPAVIDQARAELAQLYPQS